MQLLSLVIIIQDFYVNFQGLAKPDIDIDQGSFNN